MGFLNYRFLNTLESKYKKALKRHYSKRQVKYNLKLIRALFTNIASRYNMTPRKLYKCLPLKKVYISDELDYNEFHKVYGLHTNFGFKKSEIALQKEYITPTTFIHEFGHYIRFLIEAVVLKTNNNTALCDMNFISERIMLSDKKNNMEFTSDQEEMFAKSWEKYIRDGIPPNKQYKKLFDDFRMYIITTSHDKDDRDGYEDYEFFDVTIAPDIKEFFNKLIVGRKLKTNLFSKIIDIIVIIYFILFATIIIYKLFMQKYS